MADQQRRLDRHGHELQRLAPKQLDRNVLCGGRARAGAGLHQGEHFGSVGQGRCNEPVLRIGEQRHAGANARAVVVQRVNQRGLVSTCNGRAKTVVTGQQARCVGKFVGILGEQAAQHVLASAQLRCDLRARVVVDAAVDGDEAHRLHQQQQAQEKHDDPHVQPPRDRVQHRGQQGLEAVHVKGQSFAR